MFAIQVGWDWEGGGNGGCLKLENQGLPRKLFYNIDIEQMLSIELNVRLAARNDIFNLDVQNPLRQRCNITLLFSQVSGWT